MRLNTLKLFLFLSIFSLKSFSHEPLPETHSSFNRDEVDDSGRSLMFSEDKNRQPHANADIGLGYNSNPYLVKDSDIEGGGSFLLKVVPSACLSSKPKNLFFLASVSADAALILGSSQEARLVLFDANALGNSILAIENYISLHVDGRLRANRQVDSLFLASLTRLSSDIDFGVKFRPGNGVITLLAEGEVRNETYFDFNQPPAGKYLGNIAGLGTQGYYFYGKMAWEFNETEEVFFNTKFGLWQGNDESALTTSNPLWVNLGVAGLISPQVRGTLSAGYSNSRVKLKSSDTLLQGASLAFSMLADLRWKIADNSELFFKLERELSPTSVFLYTYTTLLQMDYRQKFGDRITYLFLPSFIFYEYGKPLAPDNLGPLAGNHRNDMLLSFKNELMYFLIDWLSVGLSHKSKMRWSNASDFQINTPSGKLADISGNLVSFMSQHEVLAFAKMMY